MSEVKKITKEKYTSTLFALTLISLISAGVSFSHFSDAQAQTLGGSGAVVYILTYGLVVLGGIISFVLLLAVARGVLILNGIMKSNVEFIDE